MAPATSRSRWRRRRHASTRSAPNRRLSRCSPRRKAASITAKSTTSPSACTTCGTGSPTCCSRAGEGAKRPADGGCAVSRPKGFKAKPHAAQRRRYRSCFEALGRARGVGLAGGAQGKRHANRRPVSGRGVKRDPAAELLRHQVVHDVEPEPGTALRPSGGEERIEHVTLN